MKCKFSKVNDICSRKDWDALDFAMLEPLIVYKWLLTGQEIATVNSAVKELTKREGVLAVGQAACAPNHKGSKSAASSGKRKSDSQKLAMELF